MTTTFPRFEGDDAGPFLGSLVDALSAQGTQGEVVAPHDRRSVITKRGAFSVHWMPYALGMKNTLAFGMGIPANLKRAPWTILQAIPLYLAFVWKAWTVRSRISVIHAQWISTLPGAALASLITRKPLIVTLRGSDRLFVRNQLVRAVVQILLKRAAAITAVSESLRIEFLELLNIPATRLTTIANGVDVAYPSAEELQNIADRFPFFQKPTVVYVGRVIPLKQIEFLIDLLQTPGFESFHVVIVGRCESSDYVASLQNKAAALEVSSRVHIVGPVAPATVPTIMARATLVASLSRSEGRPNSLVEALRLGCIVLASKIPPHEELIVAGENGLLVDPAQVLHWGPSILSLLANAQEIQSMREKAQKSVSDISWNQSAQEYLKVYEMACSTDSPLQEAN